MQIGMKARYSGIRFVFQNFPYPLNKEQRATNNVPVFVGLDYHQNSIQVCVMDRSGALLLRLPLQSAARHGYAGLHH